MSYESVVKEDTPKGYWRLGEPSGTSAADSSGNTQTGEYKAGPTLGVTGALAGDANTAATFAKASKQFVTVPDSATLDLGDVLSYEIWFKRASTGTLQTLIDKGPNQLIVRFLANNKILVRRNGVANICESTSTVTDTTTWHHLVVTKNGATVKIWLDGVDVTGAVTNSTLTNTAISLSIGASEAGAEEWWDGSLDEVAVYGTALSEARVKAHFAAATAGEAPTVTSKAASSVTTSGATLNGEVNPHKQATTYWWEYGTTEAFGSKTAEESAGEGEAAVSKSKAVSGLEPNTKYFFRMVAKNATGTTNGTNLNFTTSGEAPTVTSEAATGVTQTEAAVHGTVDPNNAATTYWFEYGTTEGLGSKSTEGSAGSGNAGVAKEKTLSGLTAATKYFFRVVAENATGKTNGAILNFTTEAEAPPSYSPPVVAPAQITLTAYANGGNGQAYDLTREAAGLTFSNTNQGGDEVCSFNVDRDWWADNPDLGKGNLIRVGASIDTLWVGRIQEIDRALGDAQSLTITSYGLGTRLGDVSMTEIYIDRMLSKFTSIGYDRLIVLSTAHFVNNGVFEITPARSSLGLGPALSQKFNHLNVNSVTPVYNIGEATYYSGGAELGYIKFDSINTVGLGAVDTGWTRQIVQGAQNNAFTLAWAKSEGANWENQTVTFVAGTKWLGFDLYYSVTTGAIDSEWKVEWRNIRIFGRHGINPAGTQPNEGFFPWQIIPNILGRAVNTVARTITAGNFLVTQFVVENRSLTDAISELAALTEVDYGTWGPDNVLDRTINGYFDWKAKDRETQHWIARRGEFEADLSFHTEVSSLYDHVVVSYTDEAGIAKTIERSITSPELVEAGLSPRSYQLDAGLTTEAGAIVYAEVFLALFSGFAPARGSGTLVGPVKHYRRGLIPSYYMRADGSNIRIPDILPAQTAFAISSVPDRRTTFPIQRVTVDCSGDVPRTNVDFDQASDALSILLAQQQLATQVAVE